MEECKCEKNKFKFSTKAMIAIANALLKCLAEERDIVEILGDYEMENTEEGLVVLNPCTFGTVTEQEPDILIEDK